MVGRARHSSFCMQPRSIPTDGMAHCSMYGVGHGAILRVHPPKYGHTRPSPYGRPTTSTSAFTPIAMPESLQDPASERNALADFKRIRHRQYVKKSYEKKANNLQRMRDERNALEERYTTIVQAAAHSAAGTQQGNGPDKLSLLALIDEAKRLRLENEYIMEVTAEQLKRQCRIHQNLDSYADATSAARRFFFNRPTNEQYRAWADFTTQDFLALIDEIDDREAHQTRDFRTGHFRGWQGRMIEFSDGEDKTTGEEDKAIELNKGEQDEIIEVRHKTDKMTMVGFCVSKAFDIPAQDMSDRTWAAFSSAKQYSSILPCTLRPYLELLDDHHNANRLYYREVTAGDQLFKCVFVVSRVVDKDGTVIFILREIDERVIQFSDGRLPGEIDKAWVRLRTYLRVTPPTTAGGKTKFDFGGIAIKQTWGDHVIFEIAAQLEASVIPSRTIMDG